MRAKLEIVFEDNGQITVNGPLEDKILAYGMLEAARDAIQEFIAKKNSLIATPNLRGVVKLQ